jgi:hypothetical protein
VENEPLYTEYASVDDGGVDGGDQSPRAGSPRARSPRSRVGSPSRASTRYREVVVWHGARLKRVDGEGTSLAAKLQSIAENGFDPLRCTKGATAEGGIWVATEPLEAFGHGCDGLKAFVLCLAKTHFNEWLGATSARVLQRERVLPLYSLVHV